MTFEQFRNNVESWAEVRGIYEHSTALAQALKAVSEVGELADAVIKNDKAALIDAIGDVAVCLVNVARMTGTAPRVGVVRNTTSKPIDVVAASVCKTVSDLALMVGVYQSSGYCPEEIGAYDNLTDQIGYTLGHLSMLCGCDQLDFEQCCESAWLEIKDRKGRMVADGAFVKE